MRLNVKPLLVVKMQMNFPDKMTNDLPHFYNEIKYTLFYSHKLIIQILVIV